MKLSHILLGVIVVIFIGVKILSAHVDNIIAGTYKGSKSEVNATITNIKVVCAKDAEETYALADCSTPKKPNDKKTKTNITYQFKLPNEASGRVHTVYFNGAHVAYVPKKGKQIPILVGNDDPTYSRPNYNKLPKKNQN